MSRHEKYPRHGLARALSKLNFCSRSKAVALIRSGAVVVNGIVRLDPEWPVHVGQEHIEVSGRKVEKPNSVYFMVNKQRGIATQATDSHGKALILGSLADSPSLAVAGGLDKSSEGLVLISNDSVWNAHFSDPQTKVEKTYHVQIDGEAESGLLRRIETSPIEQGIVRRAILLRSEMINSWLEIVVDEQKTCPVRPILESLGLKVLRIIRVAIGNVWLGNLPSGGHRPLTAPEVQELGRLSIKPSQPIKNQAPKHPLARRKRDPRSKPTPPRHRPQVPVDPTDPHSPRPEFRTATPSRRTRPLPATPPEAKGPKTFSRPPRGSQAGPRPTRRPPLRPPTRPNRGRI